MIHSCLPTVLSVCVIMGGIVGGHTPEIGTERGQMYPDFLLPGVEQGFVRLSDYRGKKVLLIHFASW